MGKWRGSSPPTDYKVGYRRPPESTRFQPGRSGNPRGRPRKQKSTGALLEKALSRRGRIQENGVTKYRSMTEIVLAQLVNKAAKGDNRAMKLLFDQMERCFGSTGEPVTVIHFLPQDRDL
jgi:hypothetical protein